MIYLNRICLLFGFIALFLEILGIVAGAMGKEEDRRNIRIAADTLVFIFCVLAICYIVVIGMGGNTCLRTLLPNMISIRA